MTVRYDRAIGADGGMQQAHTSRRRRWAAVAATVVALVPVLVVVFGRAGRAYLPTQDFAVLDLRVRDVWSGDLPLVGVYSRFGWNHPGPLLLWLLAPLNWLFGGAPWTTLVGHAALQGLAIVGTAWTAWRRGGLAVVLGALGVVLLTYAAIGDFVLFQPWNPHVAVVVFPWFVLLAWGVARGDRLDLVVGAIVATFLVQAHVGYAPLVLTCAVVAVAFVVSDVRRDPETRRWSSALATWRAPVLVAGIVTVVLWIPVVVDQLTESPGNLRAMGRYFLRSDDPSAGLWTALGWLGAEYRVRPPWLGGLDLFDPFTGQAWPMSRAWLLIPVGLLAVAGVLSARRGDRAAFRLVVMAAALNVVGVVTLARVTGIGYPYLFYWRIALAPLTLFACAYAIVRATGPGLARPARIAGYALLAVTVVGASAAVTREVVDHPATVDPLEPTVRAMADRLARQGGGDPVLFRVADAATRGLQGGLFDALDRKGVDVRVDEESAFQFGSHRGVTPAEAGALWYVVEDPALVSELSTAPGARVAARSTPLSKSDDAELTRLHREMAAAAADAGRTDLLHLEASPAVVVLFGDVPGLDPATLRRAAALNARVVAPGQCRCAVIAFPPDAPPDFRPITLP